MQTINQEVLDNQNAVTNQSKAFTEDQLMDHFLYYQEGYKKDALKLLKNEGFLQAVKNWVFKADLPVLVKEDVWYKMFIKHNTITGNPSLEDYLQAIASWAYLIEGQADSNEQNIKELKEKVDEQYGEILNLQNVVSELYTSVTRLQEVAFPPTTPKKPTTKVGWLDRPVSQFNKRTGEFIRNWESPRQAENVLGKVNAHAIVEHLKRGKGSSGGYIWKVGEYTKEA